MRRHTKEWREIINKAERLFDICYCNLSERTPIMLDKILQKETTGMEEDPTIDATSLFYILVGNYTNPQVSDKEIFEYRLGNFNNDMDYRYEAQTYIQYLICTKKEDESFEDLFYKCLMEIEYLLPGFVDENIKSAINMRKQEKNLEPVELLLRFIYMFIQLEYYCYYLDILSIQVINKQKELSVKDAFAYSIVTNIRLTKGLFSYAEEGYKVMQTQLLHLTCLLDIVQNTNEYHLSSSFKGITKLNVQPIVFNTFKFVKGRNLCYPNAEERLYIERYSQVFYCDEAELLVLHKPFVYSTFEDTVGLHNLWFNDISKSLCKVFITKLTANLLPTLNLLTTDYSIYDCQDVYINECKYLLDNCSVFVLAYLRTMTDYTNRTLYNFGMRVFLILECCRLITKEVYDFYRNLYGYSDIENYMCLEHLVKGYLDRFFTAYNQDTISHYLDDYKLSVYHISNSNPEKLNVDRYLSKLAGDIWFNNISENSQYYIHILDSGWGYEHISKIVSKVLLDFVWRRYQNGYSYVDCANVYYEYIYNDDACISVDAVKDSFFMKIITVYLLSISDRQRRDDIEITTRYMEMSLGL